jgi:hypothetical protein
MPVPALSIGSYSNGWQVRPGFFLPVRVLSRLFRRLVLGKLVAATRYLKEAKALLAEPVS